MPERNVGQLPLYPSSNTSADWSKVDAAVRNNAFFSACIEDERLLSTLQKLVDKALDNGWSVGGFIDEALQALDNITADRSVEKTDSFQKQFLALYDIERLRLIYSTQMALSSGYAAFVEAFDPTMLDLYPAWEFIRQPGAREQYKRDDHVQHENDIRLKTDLEYWLARNRPEIGGFGNPHGPWGFNSWMREFPVSRPEAEKLGLLKPNEKIDIPPALADWNLPQALKQVGRASVKDLTKEQQQNVVARCAEKDITITQPEENMLQVSSSSNPNDPLASLDASVIDAWIMQQVNEIAEQEKLSPLSIAFGMFVNWLLSDIFEDNTEKT